MNQLTTTVIVLARTNFGEADRIVTMLTPNYGKLRLMAKGVRRVKSKLAGGIELFSISDITFIRGRGEIGTLISARLQRHYGRIVANIQRVQLGYELIGLLNKNTEDAAGEEYFMLLSHALRALDDQAVNPDVIHLWFAAQLLRLGGHSPNLRTDASGQKLSPDAAYAFSFDDMAFAPSDKGRFAAEHIKFLRLLFGSYGSVMLQKLQVRPEIIQACAPLLQTMLSTYLRI
jgi:DNA repair protein RecO (recombination protein O)